MRRRFSPEYKLQILSEADACTEPGEINALLKREGLYHSNLSAWRRHRGEGLIRVMAPKKRGRKATNRSPIQIRIQQLERENEILFEKIKQAVEVIETQKEQIKAAQTQLGMEFSRKMKLMTTTLQLSNDVGKKAACEALQVPRASFYRHLDNHSLESIEKPKKGRAKTPYLKDNDLR